MATKKDLIQHFSEQLKKKDQKIEAMYKAVDDITRMLDAILYEVCMNYGEGDDKHLSISAPKMGDEAKRVNVTFNEDGFTLTPVEEKDGKE